VIVGRAMKGTVDWEMATDSLREEVVKALRSAVVAHQSRAFEDIGEAYDSVARQASQRYGIDVDLQVAIDFLDGWYESSRHDWQFYEPICEDDSPRVAFSLATSLETGQPIDEAVRTRFTSARGQWCWTRLRGLWQGPG
jgi:hypothetical protein